MLLSPIDWGIVGLFFLLSLVIGIAVTKRAGSDTTEFFAAGRSMPWWLLGVSMVATTFSTDTPNLVTDIVRKNGVSGNWVWWAFLLTGMLTVFVYARLWRRSGVLTDLEFYELRYSGRSAAFLRGFRAIYLGVFFNVIVMASVSLAAIKIGGVLLNLTPVQTILIACTITAIYSTLGGLRGVLYTDLFQFVMAMVGAIGAAVVALRLPQVGGLTGLLSHPEVQGKLALLPDFTAPDQRQALIALFLMPIMVQWWSVWYPGSEPGGGSYIAQRMLAAKNENHALGSVFLFNAAHYALRPWPWIIVALCSIIIYPDLNALREAFPHVASRVNDDMGYSAMLTFLPAGLLGLVVASLIAAYMSTISTHLNWGASYLVNDFYRRFVRPNSSEWELVQVGRVFTILLMVMAGLVALAMESALDNFKIMLMVGAGTGLIFILRWFWWRINAASEITAMIVSFIVAVYFRFFHGQVAFMLAETGSYKAVADFAGLLMNDWIQLLFTIGITTVSWVLVTYLTKPVSEESLLNFCRTIQPGGPGWARITALLEKEDVAPSRAWQVPQGILCMLLGCVSIYSALFATGYLIYGRYRLCALTAFLAVAASLLLARQWRRLVQ
ncbi:MAG: Sodium/glucose cotransporter [Candidatus Hydrogenedentes bacterium ADurb.Bin101]|mgnify:CR=1 FL=1|jgi:Na+/proline symporter|nr:MAG: Sodium/glucose cotransporter [Candidatus Hydrogenedentes bacterium ADurb.Bin101]HOC67406.1 Na+:solute symporter [Candidatus Hydrogenedentota bacterium]